MQNNLRLYATVLTQLRKWMPRERSTRMRNLSWLMVGLFLARSVHLSHIARKLPLPGQLPSLTNRMRRFLNNPRVDVRRYYRPVAKLLIERFSEGQLIMLIDCTPLGFNYQF
jgi:hypothetical protein